VFSQSAFSYLESGMHVRVFLPRRVPLENINHPTRWSARVSSTPDSGVLRDKFATHKALQSIA